MPIDPDVAIEASRVYIDRCFTDPELHEHLSEQKPSMLIALQRMRNAQAKRGRLNQAHYLDDMIARLKFWQYDDDL